MPEGSFFTIAPEIMDRVGAGILHGNVEVDQIYAKYQHESLDLAHPHGGSAKYLADPLNANYAKYLEEIAKTVLDDGGHAGMIAAMEDLSGKVETTAPVWFNDLRRSGHPSVSDDGKVIYDRAPKQHRLSEAEIEAKKDLDPSGWITKHGDHIYVGKAAGS